MDNEYSIIVTDKTRKEVLRRGHEMMKIIDAFDEYKAASKTEGWTPDEIDKLRASNPNSKLLAKIKEFELIGVRYTKAMYGNEKEKFYLEIGRFFFGKNLEKAAKYFNEVLSINPSHEYAHLCCFLINLRRCNYTALITLLKGVCWIFFIMILHSFFRRKNYNYALFFAKKNVKYLPNSSINHSNCGSIYYKLGDFDAALSSFSKAINCNPEFSDAHYMCGMVQDRMGSPFTALSSFKKAIKFSPKFSNAHYMCGVLYEELGDLDAALSSFKKVIEFNPEVSDAHYKCGIIYYDLGNFDAALSSFKETIDYAPANAQAFNNWGVILATMGIYGTAVDKFNKALELEPDCDVVQKNIDTILKVKKQSKMKINKLSSIKQSSSSLSLIIITDQGSVEDTYILVA